MLLVVRFVNALLTIYYWLIIIRVIVSWFPQLREVGVLRPLLDFVFDVTEPFLGLFRRIIPVAAFGGVGIDFSPFIAIITLIALQRFLNLILLSLIQ